MIIDRIEMLERYTLVRKKDIINFLEKNDVVYLPDGEIKIDGDNLLVKVMSYEPKPAAENKFEAHRFYADLQYVADGIELMQTIRREDLTPLGEYEPQGDYQFFNHHGPVNDFIVKKGEFAIFWPGEAHRPSCLCQDQKGKVKKLVFKIRIPQWGGEYGANGCSA